MGTLLYVKQEQLNKTVLTAFYNARNFTQKNLYDRNILQGIYRIKVTCFFTYTQCFKVKKTVTVSS